MTGETQSAVRILVCEDNPADVDLLRLALEDAGLHCELTVVHDGAEALVLVRGGALQDCAPNLAIIDLNLPKHGGLEILAEMRATPCLAEVPVVILSSSSSPADQARSEKLGVHRYIVKPLDLEEFLRIGHRIKEVLDQTRR